MNKKTALQRIGHFDCCPESVDILSKRRAYFSSPWAISTKRAPSKVTSDSYSVSIDAGGIAKASKDIDAFIQMMDIPTVDGPWEHDYTNLSEIKPRSEVITPRYCIHCKFHVEHVTDADAVNHTFEMHKHRGTNCLGALLRLGEAVVTCPECEQQQVTVTGWHHKSPVSLHLQIPQHEVLGNVCWGSNSVVTLS